MGIYLEIANSTMDQLLKTRATLVAGLLEIPGSSIQKGVSFVLINFPPSPTNDQKRLAVNAAKDGVAIRLFSKVLRVQVVFCANRNQASEIRATFPQDIPFTAMEIELILEHKIENENLKLLAKIKLIFGAEIKTIKKGI